MIRAWQAHAERVDEGTRGTIAVYLVSDGRYVSAYGGSPDPEIMLTEERIPLFKVSTELANEVASAALVLGIALTQQGHVADPANSGDSRVLLDQLVGWVASTGYPIDWAADRPFPSELVGALGEAWWRQRGDAVAGTRADCLAFIAGELG